MKITDLTFADAVMALSRKGDMESLKMAAKTMRLVDQLLWNAYWNTPNSPTDVYEACMPNLGEDPSKPMTVPEKMWKKAEGLKRALGNEVELMKFRIHSADRSEDKRAVYVYASDVVVAPALFGEQDRYTLTRRLEDGSFQTTLTHSLHRALALPVSFH